MSHAPQRLQRRLHASWLANQTGVGVAKALHLSMSVGPPLGQLESWIAADEPLYDANVSHALSIKFAK